MSAVPQTWLDSREIVKNTRDNYKRVLNSYWMGELATTIIDKVSSHQIPQVGQSYRLAIGD
jgi:integrase